MLAGNSGMRIILSFILSKHLHSGFVQRLSLLYDLVQLLFFESLVTLVQLDCRQSLVPSIARRVALINLSAKSEL